MNEKIKQLWEISKEQEMEFRKHLQNVLNSSVIPHGFTKEEVDDLFKLIRGAEYRRGKEDGVEMAQKEFLDKIDNSKMWITQRIADEYRKHPTLDWALIASQKIISALKQSFSPQALAQNQEKKKLTAKDILDSDMLGALKGKGESFNSIEYAKELADDMFK